jgi:hypothetical protein
MKLFAILDTETGEWFQNGRTFTRPGDAQNAWGALNQDRVARATGGWNWVRRRLDKQCRYQLTEVRLVPVQAP